MVHIVICQKCGEPFEADTASRETICPRCIMDQDLEQQIVEELWDEGDHDVGFYPCHDFTPVCGFK